MITKQSSHQITCLVVLILMTAAASYAGPSPLLIRTNGNALSLEPIPGFAHGVLTVRLRGVGVVYEQGFSPEQGLAYALQANQGEPLAGRPVRIRGLDGRWDRQGPRD